MAFHRLDTVNSRPWLKQSTIATIILLVTLVATVFQQAQAQDTSPEENKVIVQRYLDGLFNNSDFALTDELVSANFVDHGNGTKAARNREDLKNEVVFYRETFPDLHVEIAHIVAEEDKVAYQFVSRSSGPLHNGKPFMITGMIIDRIENGQIVERWENYDELGAMKYFESPPQDSTSEESLESVLPYKKAEDE
jgi:predicted ester cyclase